MIGVQENTVHGLIRKIGSTLGEVQFSAKLRGNVELDDAYFAGDSATTASDTGGSTTGSGSASGRSTRKAWRGCGAT